ncbi:glycerol-3-phosphate 1-O-acyltransferase PlsY [Sphingomonas sp. 1P06PA]|uniref:glycerol-3-phosphate 1-O-acyltransferase PlsY n=1 Tax=Sphingomonas sp. 1P06PA TaxID=554121 RepID=UPI0039A502D4
MGVALVLLLSYLLGSVPFGLILTRIAGAGDLRAIGSGNIGATNVLRTGRKGLAAATLLLDGAKGAAAVLIAGAFEPAWMPVAAAGAFFGHLYPVWLRFRGGKGVATLLGVTLALHWPSGLIFAAVWIGLLAVVRISSVAGMAAALSTPVSVALLGRGALVPLMIALALMVLWKHRDNIARLKAGTEPKVGSRKPADPLG